MEETNLDINIKSVLFDANKKQKQIQIQKQYKGLIKKEKTQKRVEAEKWTFTDEDYAYDNQFAIIKELYTNSHLTNDNHNKTYKTILQQINKKIYGYKHQDLHKNIFLEQEFITLPNVLQKMVDCELKCYYCQIEMNVLYDISREAKQWTVDRINNDLGHNTTNFYLACLDCNLKRRCRNDAKFLFTKQLKIVKITI
jgi:hypothetical protein